MADRLPSVSGLIDRCPFLSAAHRGVNLTSVSLKPLMGDLVCSNLLNYVPHGRTFIRMRGRAGRRPARPQTAVRRGSGTRLPARGVTACGNPRMYPDVIGKSLLRDLAREQRRRLCGLRVGDPPGGATAVPVHIITIAGSRVARMVCLYVVPVRSPYSVGTICNGWAPSWVAMKFRCRSLSRSTWPAPPRFFPAPRTRSDPPRSTSGCS